MYATNKKVTKKEKMRLGNGAKNLLDNFECKLNAPSIQLLL